MTCYPTKVNQGYDMFSAKSLFENFYFSNSNLATQFSSMYHKLCLQLMLQTISGPFVFFYVETLESCHKGCVTSINQNHILGALYLAPNRGHKPFAYIGFMTCSQAHNSAIKIDDHIVNKSFL